MDRVRQHTRPDLRILVLLGSFGLGLLAFVHKLFPGVVKVLVIDNPEELSRIQVRHLTPSTKQFPLAMGHTARTLCATLGSAIQAHAAGVAGMNARIGAGQSLDFGYAAVVDLYANSNIRDYVTASLADELAIAANGPLLSVQIDYVSSENGGTGAGGLTEFDLRFAPALHEATGANITSHFWLAGPSVHRGLGPRISMNAAATSVRVIDYLTDTTARPELIRATTLFELPGCGRDERRREWLLNSAMQARACGSLLADLSRVAPNNAGCGPLGNVGLWEYGFGDPLDPLTEVAPAVAQQYVPTLESLRNAPSEPHAVDKLELRHNERPQHRREVHDILADGDRIPVQQLLNELRTPSCRRDVTAVAHITATHACDVERLVEQWHTPLGSLDDFRIRWSQQIRLDELLVETGAEISTDLKRVEAEEIEVTKKVEATHHRLYPKGFNYLLAALTSGSAKRRKLRQYANRLRQIADERDRVEQELSAVTHATARVSKVRFEKGAKLNQLLTQLNGFSARLSASAPLVSAESLDHTFVSLWNAVEDEAALSAAVAGCVTGVTIDGLAKVVRSTSRNLADIAVQIVHGGCYTTAPIPWGNLPRMDDGLVIHVLPPMAKELGEELRNACRRLDPTVNLYQNDTCVAGVGIVSITMRDVKHVGHVVTPIMQAALGKALGSAYPVQYLLDDPQLLARVGISFDGKKVSLMDQRSLPGDNQWSPLFVSR